MPVITPRGFVSTSLPLLLWIGIALVKVSALSIELRSHPEEIGEERYANLCTVLDNKLNWAQDPRCRPYPALLADGKAVGRALTGIRRYGGANSV